MNKNPIKIAYIYPEILPSTKARAISAVNTANELAKISDCTLFIDSDSTDDMLRYYSIGNSELNIKKINKQFLFFKSNKIFNFNLLKELKKDNFDFIYARHLKVAKFLIEQEFNVIFECHEIFYKSNIKTKSIEEFVYSNVKGLVFINKTLKKEFNNHFKIKNIPKKAIHNGCGFEVDFIEKDFSTLNNIYYIGSLYPWKGVNFLIKAISNTNIKLKIVGNDEGKEELENYIKKYGVTNIEFLGYQPQETIKVILSTAKLTVIPNTSSVFSNFSSPIKLYEYLMTSNIVLSSNIPTVQEIITHGKNGFLFESGNEESFQKSINEILSLKNDELQNIAKNAYKTSREFTWKKRAKNIDDFLRQLPGH